MANTMSAEEMWKIYMDDGVLVQEELDDSWRHGNYVYGVIRDSSGRFWAGVWQESGDGEYNSFREGDCGDFVEVEEYEETVVVKKYREKT